MYDNNITSFFRSTSEQSDIHDLNVNIYDETFTHAGHKPICSHQYFYIKATLNF